MLCARRPDRIRTVVRELDTINAMARDRLTDDNISFGQVMTSFHEVLVRRCGNQTLVLVAGALESIFLAHLWGTPKEMPVDRYYTDESRLAEVEVHEQVTALIRAGDEAQVVQLMNEHINAERPTSGWRRKQPVSARALKAFSMQFQSR
jgi:DNA-binding FadR family transcriptional regulator